MYTIYVKFECSPNMREKFIEMVKKSGVLDAVRSEDGCIKYDFYLSEKDDNELLLIEQWESKIHQQVHLTQPHMVLLRNFEDNYISKTCFGEVDLK